MGFFKELAAELDRSPAVRFGPGAGGDISEVLKYAPSKLRPRHNADDRLSRLEAETKYWRERAFQAEVRVNRLETSIQGIAQRFGIASHFAKSE
jgi:hypothetical protein